MWEIGQELGCSVHKVTYWMKHHQLAKRTRSEAAYVKQNPKGDPFHIKTELNSDEIHLFALGIGIYWGEGSKTSPFNVSVSNTDPNLLLVFRSFLLRICQVNPNKIHYSIVCFNDTASQTAATYWSKQLSVHPSLFGKIVQIPQQGKGTYKRKSQFGVCAIGVSNIKLKRWIMEQIELQSARMAQW